MRKRIKDSFGQSVLEYALILGVVVAALTVMQVYMKRGIQIATKVAVDQLGSQDVPEFSSEDSGAAYPLGASRSRSHSKGYRYVNSGLFVSPRMDRKTTFNESTLTTSSAAYNAGSY